MYLKEIEINGFKSFADKTTIKLDDDITCIVGPNGSGKSNVVDAVRWVLGEQSIKSLRGDLTMTDVIFSGSKNRKPLNIGNVAITFDNSDNYLNIPYTEVVIKRKVYRSGENEYFLNGEKCRLKDITDLFLDSGVSKESFNIISQGEIGKILSSSLIERRQVFEEAAGVLKYKKRKEEAIRKLDRTTENTSRVSDITSEIETNLAPLKEQSEQATKYLDTKKQLESIEIALLATEITNLNENYQIYKKRAEELESEIIKTTNLTSSTKIDTAKRKILNLENELSYLNQKLLVITQEVEEINSEKKILQERSKYDASDIKVHDNLVNLKESKLKLENDLDLLNQDLTYLKNSLAEETSLIENLMSELDKLNQQKEGLLKEYNSKNKELLENKNRIDILNGSLENNSTIPPSVKKVLDNPKLSGVKAVFGNILETKEKYLVALEVAISSSKSIMIVENENRAKEAIDYLKNNNLGRVTFFPLNVIKPKGIDYETLAILEKEDDYLGILADFVTYDKIYRNIVLNQLGNVVLVTDLSTGNKISRLINNRYKIITLSGEVIHVGGSITGGSLGYNKSSATIKQELAKSSSVVNNLESNLENVSRQITELEGKISKINGQIAEEKVKNVTLAEELRTKGSLLNTQQSTLNSLREEINTLASLEDDNFSKEEEKITGRYYEKVKAKEMLVKEIAVKTKEKEKYQDEVANLEVENKINNSNLAKLEKEAQECEINISKLDIKLDNYLNTLNEDYEMTYEKAKENYELNLEIDEAKEKVNEYKNNLKELGIVNVLAIEEYRRVSERYQFLTSQKEDLLKAKDALLEIITEMNEVMKEEFLNTFLQIEKEFKKVFKELFNGGQAELKLIDPSDLLNTDIEIIASPAGKNLKSISLLSGGEKTLTAISLLFAILNVRHVPFCIFDEVESALDEANVVTFGQYLGNYKNKTQFLLVTHKKKTMEYAKTLYGITMQESGVSKLVSVKLE